MGSCFSSNEPRVKIIDEIPVREKFYYLRPEETFTYTIDRTYNIPLIEIQFNYWLESSVHLWPENNKMRKNFLLLQRTPPPSPSLSSFSLSADSGIILYFSLKHECNYWKASESDKWKNIVRENALSLHALYEYKNQEEYPQHKWLYRRNKEEFVREFKLKFPAADDNE